MDCLSSAYLHVYVCPGSCLHGTQYSIQMCTILSCIMYHESCIVYCVLCIVFCVLCIVYCVLCIVYCVLFIVYCVLCIVYCPETQVNSPAFLRSLSG
jgi:hypothetical protein